MPTKKSKDTVQVELTEEEIAVLIMVVRMGGYHRLKEYPHHLRKSDNPMVNTVSRVLKKLEKAQR